MAPPHPSYMPPSWLCRRQGTIPCARIACMGGPETQKRFSNTPSTENANCDTVADAPPMPDGDVSIRSNECATDGATCGAAYANGVSPFFGTQQLAWLVYARFLALKLQIRIMALLERTSARHCDGAQLTNERSKMRLHTQGWDRWLFAEVKSQ